MEVEDIPAWVPEPARRAAAIHWPVHPLMNSLLSDPAMERVWQFLHERPVKDDFRKRFEDGTGLRCPDLRDVDLHRHDAPKDDQALVFLFYAALVAVNNTRETPDRNLIDAEIGKLRETQRLVEDLRIWGAWPALKMEPHIERAILDIVALCDERAAMLDHQNKPSVVDVKNSKSTIESTVRSIGAATYAIYGQCCYGQLAVMANVMFAPSEQITVSKAEKWCPRPPLPGMPDKNGRSPKKLH